MIYRNFQVNIISRVIVIVALSFAIAFISLNKPMFFSLFALLILLLIAVGNLIRYIHKTTRDLTHFLLSVRQGAWTQSLTSGSRGKEFGDLSNAFNDVIREFEKVALEKERHYQYLQALNENINVAIFSFDSAGKLLMINPAGKQLLRQPKFSHIEDFRKADVRLYEGIRSTKPNEKKVMKVHVADQLLHLGIQVKDLVIQSVPIKVVLLQNLSSELETHELEAWHQLMRVLTHEIMNSVTPIVSLTQAMQSILMKENETIKTVKELTEDNLEDVVSSVDTIASRSRSLLRFIHAYKAYAKPLEVHLKPTNVRSMIDHVIGLLSPDLQNLRIDLKIAFEDDVVVMADDVLIGQVLINLIKNAMEAVSNDGSGAIAIRSYVAEGDVSISITDNGKGIDEDTINKIFVPFYTTKPKGTGIGLSLSRQIMRSHHGSIRVHQDLSGTTFVITLPRANPH